MTFGFVTWKVLNWNRVSRLEFYCQTLKTFKVWLPSSILLLKKLKYLKRAFRQFSRAKAFQEEAATTNSTAYLDYVLQIVTIIKQPKQNTTHKMLESFWCRCLSSASFELKESKIFVQCSNPNDTFVHTMWLSVGTVLSETSLLWKQLRNRNRNRKYNCIVLPHYSSYFVAMLKNPKWM